MQVTLLRIYNPAGTNGTLLVNNKPQCLTIELPWRDNNRQVSCIPEGEYVLKARRSAKYGNHILVTGVPGRSLILFHPANNAKTELRGCIAPVTKHTGIGMGSQSRLAFTPLLALCQAAWQQGETVILTIKKAE